MNKLVLSFMTTTFIASAVFAQSSTSTSTTSAAPTSGVSKATVPTPSAIKGSFTHISSVPVKIDPTASRYDTQNVIGLSYKPAEITYGASIKALYHLAGSAQKVDGSEEIQKQSDVKTAISDLKLTAAKGIGTIGSSDDITFVGVAWLPTSNASHKANQYSALGAEIYIPFKLANNFSTQLAFFPKYSVKAGNDNIFNETFAEIRYSYNDKVSSYFGVYHDVASDIGTSLVKNKETIAPELGVDISFPEIADVTVAVTQNRNILSPAADNARKQFAVFAPEEVSVGMQAVFKF